MQAEEIDHAAAIRAQGNVPCGLCQGAKVTSYRRRDYGEQTLLRSCRRCGGTGVAKA